MALNALQQLICQRLGWLIEFNKITGFYYVIDREGKCLASARKPEKAFTEAERKHRLSKQVKRSEQ